MKQVTVLVFSKNRPMQLHALLQSYGKYCRDTESPQISVLYKADAAYEEAYAKVMRTHVGSARFIRETSFFRDCQEEIARKPYVAFLVDDAVFFRPFRMSHGAGALASDERIVAFSYRLGANVTYNYVHDIHFERPAVYARSSPTAMVCVDWRKHDRRTDFGFPFEVSSSMYRRADVQRLFALQPHGWDGPNRFEATGAATLKENAAQFGSYIATYYLSTAVSLALNRVQSVHRNRSGTDREYSPEALLRKFDAGLELDLDVLNERGLPNSAHAMLALPFRARLV